MGLSAGVTQSRGFVRDAITAMKQYAAGQHGAASASCTWRSAFFEMTLADNFCNGIPLGHTINGVQTYGMPLTIAQVYDSASTHLDTAIALSNGERRQRSVVHKRPRDLQGARADRRRTSTPRQPRSLRTGADDVPVRHDVLGDQRWQQRHLEPEQLHRTRQVGDSFDVVSGAPTVIKNALPFASANDPRVPVDQRRSGIAEGGAEDRRHAVLRRRCCTRASSIRSCSCRASTRD